MGEDVKMGKEPGFTQQYPKIDTAPAGGALYSWRDI